MEAFQTRLDSFSQSTRVKSTTAKSAASLSLKWPHPHHFKATPNTLAEAGFYFNPSWDDRDAVTCYMCSKELSDWAEHDDPFQIHWTKCKKLCAWAVVRCGLIEDVGDDGKWVFSETTRFPSGKAMERARLDTFRDWPYDSEKNHGATSKKMARAGFVYTPQSSTDDTATCLYCNLALSGWDADDDPLQEHRKREKKSGDACPFFSATSPPIKPNVLLSRASSKAPSRPKPTKLIDDQSQLSDDELATAEVLTGRKKTARGRSMAPNAGSSDPLRMSTRKSTRVASGKTATVEVEDEGTVAEIEKAAPKKRKGSKKNKVEVIEEEGEAEPEPKEAKKTAKKSTNPEPDAVPAPTKGPSRKTKGKKKTTRTVVASDTDTDTVPSTNPPKTLTRSKSYARANSNSDVPVSTPVPPKPSKSKKTKKPASKVEGSVSPPLSYARNPDVKVVDISTDDDDDDDDGVAAMNIDGSPRQPIPSVKLFRAQGHAAVAPLTAEPVITAPGTKTRENMAPANVAENYGTEVAKVSSQPPPPWKPTQQPDAAPLPKPKKGQPTAAPITTELAITASNSKTKGNTVTDATEVVNVPPRPAPPSKPTQQPTAEPDVQKPRKGKKKVAVEIVQVIKVPTPDAKPVEPSLYPQATRTPPKLSTPPRPTRAVSPGAVDNPTLTNGINSAMFIPPLATIPMPKIVSLTERDLDMTVEEWIRHEMAVQYEQFKGDGERAIEMFKKRTAEVRRAIEAL